MSEPMTDERLDEIRAARDGLTPIDPMVMLGYTSDLLDEVERMRKRWTPESELSAAELLMLLDKNQARKTRYIAKYGDQTYLGLCDRARRETHETNERREMESV